MTTAASAEITPERPNEGGGEFAALGLVPALVDAEGGAQIGEVSTFRVLPRGVLRRTR